MLQKTLVVLFVATLFFGAGVTPINVAGSSEQKSENDMGRDAGSLNDGLVAYWKLDEGNGNIIHDCSGNGNDGIIYGAKWTSGICGNALNFDGYNDHVDIFSPVWNTAPYSICVWVKSDTFIGNHYIIANGGETRDSYGFYMKIDWSVSDGDWRFGVSNKDGSRYGDAHAPPASGGWTFLCGTWDGSADPSEIKLYVNGTLEDTGSASYNWRTGSSNNLRIGGPSNAINYLFDGLIDEIRIYNRVLNEEEIRFLYNHPGGGSPPSADFKVNKTGDPRIIEFNAVGSNLTDCLLKWDLNGDKKWDKIGWFNDTKTVLYEYPEAGVYNATLYVENPVGNNSCTKKFAVLTNYNINWSNHGFFLSYPTTTLTPPLKNKYVFKCSPGVLDHVVFQFGNKNYSDNTPSLSDNSDVWEAVINMNEGKHGDKIKVLGYDRENNLIWEDEADTFILITPPWFNAFLLLSDITVYNSENYSYWNITIVPPNIGLGYKMDKVPVKYIGGKYGVNATVTGPQNFTIESSQTLTVYYPLCSLDIPLFSKENKTKKPVNLGSYKKARWNINVDFAATADVQINPKEVALAGCLTLQGNAGVSFDVPVAGIPFLAEAGLSGGVDAEFGTRFVIARLADNGFTFCPEGFSNVFFDLEGQAGLYAQVLWGLGRLEGGLYAGGKLNMKLPSLETYMHLYGGVYAKACCWKWCSEWSYGIEFESTDDSFKWKRLTDTRTRSTENMDLLCLKDSNRKTPPHERSLNSSLNVLAYNVVGNAYPKIVLTEKGDGVAVWTDINWVDNNSFQSDIWWSKYSPDIGWSKPQNINTTNSCEYNPTLTVITNNNGSQKVLMTFLKINNVININSSINDFYKNNTICTAVLTPADTWRFSDKNISAFNGTINSKQVCDAGNNTVYMVYLVDTDSHPWKNGNGSIKLVKGFVNNSTVEWQQPLVLKTLDSFNFNCDPCVSFLTPNVGGVGYTWFNETSGWNETILLATSSGLNFTELTIRNTNLTVEYTCCSTFNNSIIVSWIENRSKILSRQINVDDSDPKNWTMNNITEIYSSLSISYIKPIYTNQHIYYLFQAEKEFIPFIIELSSNGSWGKTRQITLDGSYSAGQLDGDSNLNQSQMIYVRDTPVENWQIGHWKFNEGKGNVTIDSSGNKNNGYIIGLSEENSSVYWFRNNGENNNLSEEYGYGLGFVNKTGYVYIPHNNSLNTPDEFTVCGWIKLYSYSNGTSLIDKNGSWLLFEKQGKLGFKLWRKEGVTFINNITTLPLDTWMFITALYDNGRVNVSVYPTGYKNVSIEFALNDTSINTTFSPLIIGGFNGTIDEIRLFNRAVTGEIIDRIWFAPHATLGSMHDVVVQPFPSFASFDFNLNSLKTREKKITTEDVVKFTGEPPGFSFNWDFDDGTTGNGSIVYHRFTKPGFYKVVMKATDPETGVTTPFTKTIHVWDATPPMFNGLEYAEAENCCVNLSWNNASDDSPFVLYYVYMNNVNSEFNYNHPCLITTNTSCTIHNLKPGVTYCFTVKAKDSAGNTDNNTVVKTTTPFDHLPPVFNGIKKALNISNAPGKILLSWDKAKDCSSVVYNIYVSTTPHGYNLSEPYNTTKNNWYIFKCKQNKKYYFAVKAEDVWGNKENNTKEVNATPVWEKNPPEITDVKVKPVLQEAGETVNITCKVKDNYFVNKVSLNITYPDGTTRNLTITHNKTTNGVYYCNKTYTLVGEYSYFIWATDECDNSNKSSTHSFFIQDTTPPEITNVIDYPDPQKEKGYVNISCNVTDNSKVNMVKVNITYPDGSWVNTTMLGNYYHNITYNITGIYQYFIWANDTSNNINTSEVYRFEIKPLDVTPPVTTKNVGEPRFGENNEWVTSHTMFNFTATDDYSGVNKTLYRIWFNGGWTKWINYTGNFTLSSECKHYLEYYSIDNAGNIEEVHNQTHYVDDMPPETIIGYNKPYHFINKTVWVTSNTTIFLKTDDKPMCACGVNNTQYRIDNGKWKMYSQPFRVTGECVHIIQYYSIDNLNNKEKTKSQIVYVDNTPPETTLEIKGSHVGDPFTSKPFFVTTNTHFLLHSKDNQSECNVGTRNIYYRIWNTNSGWSNWSIYQDGPFSTPGFTLKEECLHYIEYYSDDYLGNKETVHNISCYVDNTPPTTIGYGYYPIHLIARDPGWGECPAVGGYHIHYRHKVGDNGEWSQWFVGGLNEDITLWLPKPGVSPMGQPIYVDYYAVDVLGNKEETHHGVFTSETKPYHKN